MDIDVLRVRGPKLLNFHPTDLRKAATTCRRMTLSGAAGTGDSESMITALILIRTCRTIYGVFQFIASPAALRLREEPIYRASTRLSVLNWSQPGIRSSILPSPEQSVRRFSKVPCVVRAFGDC
jgi:hypothetical protein